MSYANGEMERFSYDDSIVRKFIIASVFWGLIAFILGVLLALQLADFRFNFGLEWLTFGRIRPIHTNAAIFAFVGNGIFAGVYYSLQRLCKARLLNDFLSKLHFVLWQFIIVCAAVSLFAGFSHGKEYAELEWPIDILITIAWVIFAVNVFGTLIKRREKHIYVAIWFYIATILTVAVLHIVNSLELPVSFMKSYPIYAGVQDALVQWWYGHNAVAFFLTTPFLGLMYYFVPKAINRPVYSYRLSIIHFWSLVFIYIWAGPHHLLYSSLPDWAQTLGMIFSVMLWAPSWGGMVNGLLTMRGAWDRVRREPVLKFFAAAITFYGMSTFEGPLLSIKSVNSLAHFTDWIIGHVHSGTIGWNYFMVVAIFYYLIPKLWKSELYSIKLANWQFWTATLGLIIYIVSMWTAGITQSLMWRAIDSSGKLIYPFFMETVVRILPMYYARAVGGLLILTSFILFIVNVYKTIKAGQAVLSEETFMAPSLKKGNGAHESGHRKLEGIPMVFSLLVLISILVGSVIEILPSFMSVKFVEKNPNVKPYTPLEVAGRDIYIREGCYTCHSQLIRPMPHEVLRYGKISDSGEFIYDHPFQWGSRRIGPDLARVGGKYPDMWHFRHMIDPREVTQNSIMPKYPWLTDHKINYETISKKLSVLKALGIPYSDEEIANAKELAETQAQKIVGTLASGGVPETMKDKQIVALIAYLQRLGVDGGKNETASIE